MREVDVDDAERMARAREAADLLFDAEDASAVDVYEPRSPLEANAAVQRFGQLFEELPGSITRVLEGSQWKRDLTFQRPASGPCRDCAERRRRWCLSGPTAPNSKRTPSNPRRQNCSPSPRAGICDALVKYQERRVHRHRTVWNWAHDSSRAFRNDGGPLPTVPCADR